MMSTNEAADYAPQWGSYVQAGDPGAVMYGDAADAETAGAMAACVRADCLDTAEAGDCCGTGSPCSDDVARLESLLEYPDDVARGPGA